MIDRIFKKIIKLEISKKGNKSSWMVFGYDGFNKIRKNENCG